MLYSSHHRVLLLCIAFLLTVPEHDRSVKAQSLADVALAAAAKICFDPVVMNEYMCSGLGDDEVHCGGIASYRSSCEGGFFSSNVSTPADQDIAVPCCPGHYCDSRSTCLRKCDEGSFCPTAITNESNIECDIPLRGLEKLTDGSLLCPGTTRPIPCPQGFVCSTPASIQPCPSGRFCPVGSAQTLKCTWDFNAYCPPRTFRDDSRFRMVLTVVFILSALRALYGARSAAIRALIRKYTATEPGSIDYPPSVATKAIAIRKCIVWRGNGKMTLHANYFLKQKKQSELVIQPGFTAFIGASGAGKSTLLSALCKVLDSSSVSDVSASLQMQSTESDMNWSQISGKDLGLVPQDDKSAMYSSQTAIDAVLCYAAMKLGQDTESLRESGMKLFKDLDLSQQCDQPLESLSGGQLKRVNVAMELLCMPTILFLDEPTSGLDTMVTRRLLGAIARRYSAKSGRFAIAVIHQPPSEAALEFDNVVSLAPIRDMQASGSGSFGAVVFPSKSARQLYQEHQRNILASTVIVAPSSNDAAAAGPDVDADDDDIPIIIAEATPGNGKPAFSVGGRLRSSTISVTASDHAHDHNEAPENKSVEYVNFMDEHITRTEQEKKSFEAQDRNESPPANDIPLRAGSLDMEPPPKIPCVFDHPREYCEGCFYFPQMKSNFCNAFTISLRRTLHRLLLSQDQVFVPDMVSFMVIGSVLGLFNRFLQPAAVPAASFLLVLISSLIMQQVGQRNRFKTRQARAREKHMGINVVATALGELAIEAFCTSCYALAFYVAFWSLASTLAGFWTGYYIIWLTSFAASTLGSFIGQVVDKPEAVGAFIVLLLAVLSGFSPNRNDVEDFQFIFHFSYMSWGFEAFMYAEYQEYSLYLQEEVRQTILGGQLGLCHPGRDCVDRSDAPLETASYIIIYIFVFLFANIITDLGRCIFPPWSAFFRDGPPRWIANVKTFTLFLIGASFYLIVVLGHISGSDVPE